MAMTNITYETKDYDGYSPEMPILGNTYYLFGFADVPATVIGFAFDEHAESWCILFTRPGDWAMRVETVGNFFEMYYKDPNDT